MHARRFKAEVRRRVSRDLVVVRGARAARKMNLPRETIMVFEKSRSGYFSFVHACLNQHGQPREPIERDIDKILAGAGHNVHRGRRGWIDDVSKDRDEEIREQQLQVIRDIHKELVTPMTLHRTGHGRIYTTGKG